MELGGSDPCIVLKDADLDLAVNVSISSRLRNEGQTCNCAKRFIIHESIYEEFKKKLVNRLKTFKIGDPMKKDSKIGPLGSERILKRIFEQIEDAKK